MKTKKLLLCALCVVVCVGLTIFTSCSKDIETTTTNLSTQPTALEKVTEFLNAKDKKSGFDDLSIDEAVWYLEAALNYSYCTEHNMYGNEMFDSLVIPFILDEAGLIDDAFLFETYSNLESVVNDIKRDFHSSTYFNIIVLDIEAYENEFVLHWGVSYGNEAKCLPSAPFGSTQYWDYNTGGRCGGYSGCSGYGAKAIFESNINGFYGMYPKGCWFEDVSYITLYCQYSPYPLFASWDACLTPTQMNTYYSNTYNQGFYRMPANRNFISIEMQPYDESFYYHEARWRYGILHYPIEE